MSNLYQTTTESLESLDRWPSCAPPLPCKKRRGMDESHGKRSSSPDEFAQQGSSGENSQTDKKSGMRYSTVINLLVCCVYFAIVGLGM